ncbi:MAG: response regulator transcription factor [Piscirickettsiaceae bacterium]|nr:response regulator transcription factor [Piscirickettsiaceae bacterium]
MTKIHCCYRLEQLARLGLPSQIFIPALLQELHHDIPSLSNTFCWQNNEGKLSNIFDETHNTIASKKFITSMSSTNPDKYLHTTNWISELDQPTTSFEQYEINPHLKAFYKTVLLPMGYINSYFMPIFHTETKKRLGVLMIHRQKGESDFTKAERAQLQNIAALIAYGLQQPETKDLYTTDGWEQGLLIVNRSGKLHHACSMGEKLLSLASSSRFDASTKQFANDLFIFNNFQQLLANLFNSDNVQNASINPTLATTNAWGEFKLRAFLIKDMMGDRDDQIGLNIRWQEPFVLKLFHRIRTLNLTPRQETVGLLYAAGNQHQTIADKLNLSLYTVKDHVKNIVDRLAIHSRVDLIELILCDRSSI